MGKHSPTLRDDTSFTYNYHSFTTGVCCSRQWRKFVNATLPNITVVFAKLVRVFSLGQSQYPMEDNSEGMAQSYTLETAAQRKLRLIISARIRV